MHADEDLTGPEIRRRAIAGAVAVGARGIAIRGVQFIGMILLARFLAPASFGLVAIGMSVLAFGSFLADFGLGASLIRRPQRPEPRMLESLLGFQLVGALIVAGTTVLVTYAFHASPVTAVIVGGLPLLAARAPTGIVLERNLNYRPLASAEVLESVVYYAIAIAGAAAGWGAWALAVGAVVRSAAGTATVLVLAESPVIRPRWSWFDLRQMFAFGLRYQAVGLTNLARDQGLNVGIASVAGVSALGIWTFANRLLQVPFLLFSTLWRVSFPAMSRLVAVGEDPAPVIARALSLTAVATGFLLVPLAGTAPVLVPVLLGPKWHSVTDVLPWPCLGLMVSGPISVAVAGYLYAIGDARTPLRATLLHTVAWLAIGLGLLPVVGVASVGYGWLGSCLCDAVVLGRGALSHVRFPLLSCLARPTAAAAVAAGVGWFVSAAGDPSLAHLAAALIVAEATYAATLLVIERATLLDIVNRSGAALRGSPAGA